MQAGKWRRKTELSSLHRHPAGEQRFRRWDVVAQGTPDILMTDLLRTLPVRLGDRFEEAVPLSLRLRLAVKRSLDVVLALVGLLLTGPALLLIGMAVRLASPGSAFFRQSRVGAGGRRFEILKFRTMVENAEEVLNANPELRRLFLANSFKIPVELDPRVTPIGRFLRRTSLDELPQLWNVLRGDMSLVGPRPIEASQVQALYGHRQALYLGMRPGLTGHWQVSGRSTVGDEDRAELDVHYLRNWSLRLDLWIMLKTLPAVLRRHGAY